MLEKISGKFLKKFSENSRKNRNILFLNFYGTVKRNKTIKTSLLNPSYLRFTHPESPQTILYKINDLVEVYKNNKKNRKKTLDLPEDRKNKLQWVYKC